MRIRRLVALVAAVAALVLVVPAVALATAPWEFDSVITASNPTLGVVDGDGARGVAVDSAGNSYVADPDNNRVVKFDATGTEVWSIGTLGAGNAEFSSGEPRAVAVDASGDLFVSDGTRVQILSASSGDYVGVLGAGFDEFGNAAGITVGPASTVYVADNVSMQVAKYTLAGSLVGRLNTDIRPLNVAVAADGTIYMTGMYPVGDSDVVARMTSGGTALPDIGQSGSGPKQFLSPQGLSIDSAGNIYVVDSGNARIQRLNNLLAADGEYVGGFGTEPGQFNAPAGLARDTAGKLYIADTDHVLVLRPVVVPTKGTVKGKVVDANGAVQGVSIHLLQQQNDVWTLVYTGNTDPTGAYKIDGVAPGSYQVQFSDPAGWHIAQYYDHVSSQSLATPISVVAGVTNANIDASITPAGNISGTVSDPIGVVANAGVSVYRMNQGSLEYVTGTSTHADGTYSVRSLPAGDYRLGFSDPTGMHATQYYSGVTNPMIAQSVTVVGGAVTSGINVSLVPGGTVAGAVSDSLGPLQGVSVQAFKVNGTSMDWVTSTTSASDGSYLLKGLPAGDYKISFTDPTGMHVTEYFDGATGPNTATVVTVTAGQARQAVDALMDAGGNVTGQVMGGSTPLPGMSVQAFQIVAGNMNWIASTTTASDGTYTLKGLPAGNYKISFSDTTGMHVLVYFPNASSPDAGSLISVSTGATTTGVNGNLATGGNVSGTVRDYRGVQTGMSVQAFKVDGANMTWISSTTSGSNGTYQLKGLLGGTYKISFSDPTGLHAPQYYGGSANPNLATIVSVSGGGSSTGIDANLAPGGVVDGRVNDSVGHLAGISVQAFKIDGNGGMTWITSTTTNSQGRYYLRGLPTGNYKFSFTDPAGMHVPQYYSGASSPNGATVVTVFSFWQEHNIDAVMASGGQISGTVGDGADPLAGMSISAFLWDGVNMNWVTSTSTAANGTFTLKGLPAGNYKVSFTDPNGMHVSQYFNAVSNPNAAQVIPVTTGATYAGVNAILAPAGNIAGAVTDGVSPIAGMSVQAFKFDGVNMIWTASATTAANGTYILKGLGWGSYKISFSDPSGMRVPQYFNGATGPGSATLVPLTVGVTTGGVDAALAMGGTMSGRVTDAQGNLAGVIVSAYKTDGGQFTWIGSGTSGSDGTYLLKGLPVGTYAVSFTDPTGMHAPIYYANSSTSTSATPVTIVGNTARTGVDVTLAPGGNVGGTVTDSLGGVSGVSVAAFRVEGANLVWVASATTAADGTYTIKGLPGTTYKLSFTDKNNRHVTQWYSGATSPSSATPILVGNGSTLGGVNALMIQK